MTKRVFRVNKVFLIFILFINFSLTKKLSNPRADAKAASSKWTFPDIVRVAEKKKRCKAARKAKEDNAFRMWNPMEYKV